MNILPKKRWHVRTKENIARVRRDEAQAAEEEKEKERRIKLAEKEARRDLMRAKAREKYGAEPAQSVIHVKSNHVSSDANGGHVNFFADEEAGLVSSSAVNKEHEEEKKEEREKYEKQIGYLTYLGQDTNESTGRVSWYNKFPERDEHTDEEKGLKFKISADPLNSFRKLWTSTSCTASVSTCKTSATESVKVCSKRKRSKSPESTLSFKSNKPKKKKRKNHHKEKKKKSRHASQEQSDSSDDSSDNEKKIKLEKLRAERLHREKEEKIKADKLMAKLNGVAYKDDDEKPQPTPVMKQKYNSQFNPDLAKQNYDDQRYRF